MGICSQRDTEGTCKTKIGELEIMTFVDKQVLRFQVAMENPMYVAVE